MKTRKFLGFLLYGGLVLLVACLVYVDGTFWLERYVREQLTRKVSEATQGQYRLEIGNVSLTPLTGSGTLEHIRLHTDTARYRRQKDISDLPLVEASVDRLEVKGANLLGYLFNHRIEADAMLIGHPRVALERDSKAAGSGQEGQKNLLASLPDQLAPFASSVVVNHFSIGPLSFRYASRSKQGTAVHQADSIRFALRDVRIDDTTRRPFYARAFTFSCRQYAYTTPDTLYQLVVREGRMDNRSGKLVLRNASYLPLGSDGAFKRKKTYQHDRYRVGIDRIETTGLDYYQLFHQKKLIVHRVALTNANVGLFRDRNQPKNPDQKGFMPNDFFRRLPLYVRVDEAVMRDVDLSYEEIPPNASRPAAIEFLNSSATLTNLTNDPERMSPEHPATLSVTSFLYGTGKMEIRASVPLLQPELQGRLEGNLTGMPAPVFNQILAPYTHFAIREGYIAKLSFGADVVNGTAKGDFRSRYKNLSLRVTNRQGETRELLTLLGNLALEGANRSAKEGEASVTVPIRHTHKPANSFVFFVWSTIRDGILKTLKPEILE